MSNRDLARKRILIVEDESVVAMDIERSLTELGYEVVGHASRGREALEKAGEHRPHLVLMDIRLKGGMDGIEAACSIRKQFGIPVVFLTAYADEPTLQRAKVAEPYGYLLKPFEEKELHTVIEIALHKHHAVEVSHGETKEALRQSEQQVKLFIESVRDYAIYSLDRNGRILTWNPGAERIKGYSRRETIGRHFSIFYPAEEIRRGTPERVLEMAMAEGQCQLEGWRLRKDGSRFWAEVTVTAIRDAAGSICGFGKVTRDITERKAAVEVIHRLNAELEQRVRDRTAELEAANKELEAFCYSVSHDLRAPLRGISGYVAILMDDYASRLDDEGNRLLEVVSGEAKRMGRLIDDLLAFSRVGRQQMENSTVDLTNLARGVFEALTCAVPESALRFELKPLPPASGDPAMLRQVFANLIANAIKFTRPRPARLVEVGGWSRDGEVTCYVKDNGVGFDEQYRHRLFGVFERLHSEEEFEGTGVGLALVQRVIQRHGGRVWAEGKPGQGATFYFALPLPKDSASN